MNISHYSDILSSQKRIELPSMSYFLKWYITTILHHLVMLLLVKCTTMAILSS